MEKKIGKIQKVSFGSGGYQDAQFGLSLTLGSDGWGVATFEGHWSAPPSSRAQWTLEDQTESFGELSRKIIGYLSDAKIADVAKLQGVPVECTFDRNTLESWRILTEVI